MMSTGNEAQPELVKVTGAGDGVTVIEFNRPSKANAFSEDLLRSLAAELTAAQQDPAVGAVVVTGGDRVFAAGGDLREWEDKTPLELWSSKRNEYWRVIGDDGVVKGERDAFVSAMHPGSRGHGLFPAMHVESQDLVCARTRYSALFPGSSNLDAILRGRGIGTVLIAGIATNVCCTSTARDAMMMGYRVIMLCDGCGCRWLQEKTRRNRASTEPHSRRAHLEMWSGAHFADEARGLSTPYLVLTGEYDIEGLRAAAMTQTFLAMHPGAQVEAIPNCGHYPMQECPPFFATVIEQFLARHA